MDCRMYVEAEVGKKVSGKGQLIMSYLYFITCT